MKKEKSNDIVIEVGSEKSVNSVSVEEAYSSTKNTIRTMKMLSDEYNDDEDFGRNIRKFLNVI